MTEKSTLIFAPHHDDEAIGCGGKIKQLTNSGTDVKLAVVTSGYSGIAEVSAHEAIAKRDAEANAAAAILGISKVVFMGLRDHALVFDEATLHQFVRVIRNMNPGTVFLPHELEMDRDHRLVNELGREAAWLSNVGAVMPEVEAVRGRIQLVFYEVWTPMTDPNLIEVIDGVWPDKIKAIEAYASQLVQADYLGMAEGLNKFRAIQGFTGGRYAEAYRVK